MKSIPGKDIVFVDNEGNYSLHSTEEILTSRLNSWYGWKCGAGSTSIHITADGNVFSATCKVGGMLGNVFDYNMTFPEEMLVCTKKWCMCGADMSILKFAPDSKLTELGEAKNFSESTIEKPHSISMSNLAHAKEFPQIISWDIGRRCNYKCSYCPSSTANNFEAHKSFESLQVATESIIKKFCKGKRAKWVFTGGEPTINPGYLDLIKYIVTRGHVVHTQTNGSRDPDYFSKLIEVSSVGISVHFEELNEKRFIDNCEAILAKKIQHEISSLNWFGIRFMVPPGGFERALELKNQVTYLNNIVRGINSITMSPLYRKDDGEKLMDYSPEELEAINRHA